MDVDETKIRFYEQLNAKTISQGHAQNREKMMKRASKILEEGQNVSIRVPDVDRSKLDPRYVHGVVIEAKDSFYKVGTDLGKIDGLFSANQLNTIQENFLTTTDVPDISYSLRRTSGMMSSFDGQGFFHCNCKTGCTSDRCKCKKIKDCVTQDVIIV